MSEFAGKRVVITRPKENCHDFADLLAAHGAIPICFPVIEISPLSDFSRLDAALQDLETYDWWVLTSANGVKAVWERLGQLGIDDIPPYVKIACIGPKTAAALDAQGISPDFIPEEYVGEAILPGLGPLQGQRVLLTRAEIARPVLPEAIRAAGGTADDICAYRTVPASPDRDALNAISRGVDVITFTSPSTVDNLAHILSQAGIDPFSVPQRPISACIGPITAKAAAKNNYPVDLVAEEYTTEGLLDSLLKFPFGVHL